MKIPSGCVLIESRQKTGDIGIVATKSSVLYPQSIHGLKKGRRFGCCRAMFEGRLLMRQGHIPASIAKPREISHESRKILRRNFGAFVRSVDPQFFKPISMDQWGSRVMNRPADH